MDRLTAYSSVINSPSAKLRQAWCFSPTEKIIISGGSSNDAALIRVVGSIFEPNDIDLYIARLTGDDRTLTITGTPGKDVITVGDTTYTLTGRTFAIGSGVTRVDVYAGAGDDLVTGQSKLLRPTSLFG